MEHINATTGYEVREEQGRGRVEWKRISGVKLPDIILEIRTVVGDTRDETHDEWSLNTSSIGALSRFEVEMFHRAMDHAMWVMGKLEEEEAE